MCSAACCSALPSPICGIVRCRPGSPFTLPAISYNQAQAIRSPHRPATELCRPATCRICRTTRSRARVSPLRSAIRCIGRSSAWALTYSFDRFVARRAQRCVEGFVFQSCVSRNLRPEFAVTGIITSKILPSFSFNTLDASYQPHSGKQLVSGRRDCRPGRHGQVGSSDRAVQAVHPHAEAAQCDWHQLPGFVPHRLRRCGRAPVPTLLPGRRE